MSTLSEIAFTRNDGGLIPIDKVKEQLAKLTDPSHVNDFARRAAAAKRACEQTDERREYFTELAIWATVRLGELLKAMPKQNGARGNPGGQGAKLVESRNGTPQLAAIGIKKNTASRSQKLASAKEVIPKYIAECKATGKEITKGGALAAAKRHLRGESLAQQSTKNLPAGFTITAKQDVVQCDSVITDPPYGITQEEWEPKDLENFTREWLSRWNQCGAAWFVSFFSQAGLWQMRTWMDQELYKYSFHHLVVWHYPNGMGHKAGQVLKESWEPVFVYRRRDFIPVVEQWNWAGMNNLDCIREGAPRPGFEGEAEQRHPCQKPVRALKLLAVAFCPQNGLIADPFCGSGTTGIAARQAGRCFHGIEINAEYRQLAKSRILAFGEPA